MDRCRVSTRRITLADGLRYAAFGAALSFGLASVAAVPCDGLSQGKPEKIPIRPGVDVEIEVPATSKGMLIEEFGGDLQVRAAPDAEFVDIVIRPSRLGIAAIRARSTTLTLRLNPAHAAASIVVRSRCANESDLRFFEALSRRYSEQIEAGAKQAKEAIPQIQQELTVTADRVQRAWLLHALANALLSSGRHDESSEAFKRARVAWTAADDPVHAAVALLAVGEDLSRTGEYDLADVTLREAEAELRMVGLTYYELRARTQRCLILSRSGKPSESVACETEVAKRYEALGEIAAAGASGISIANLWLKLGKLELARERLVLVDKYGASLLPVTRAKLHSTFGTYYLQTGELDNAVRELQAASMRMGEIGLPADQANVDLKLAWAAQQAGAYAEELRLLERSITLLGDAGPPDQRSAVAIRAANASLVQGNVDAASQHLATAETICRQLDKPDCNELVVQSRVLLLLQTHDYAKARRMLESLPTLKLAGSVVPGQLLAARLQLAESHPDVALSQLDAIPRDFSNLDYELDYALLRGQALVATGRRQLALQWLQTALRRMVSQTQQFGAAALRASARHRVSRLQSALFDLVEVDSRGGIQPSTLGLLREAIDMASPIGLLSANGAPNRFSDDLRPGLSAAVERGTAIDQRQLFFALAAPTDTAGTLDSSGSRPGSPDRMEAAGTNSPALMLLPLPGEAQFRLIAWKNGEARQCLVMSRTEYDQLTLRFQNALDGRSVEIPALDSLAQYWYDAIIACHPQASMHWVVVANAGSRSIPWAWITARAESRAQAEPTLSIQFDTHLTAERSLRSGSASILNLDLSGDAALPFAAMEATRVAESLAKAGVSVRVPPSAAISVESLFAEMSTAGAWVHVIGHGNPTSYGSLYAGIWLPSPTGPSLVAFPEIASAHLSADLVVLSACGDAKNDRNFAGSRLRLAEGLLAAGVSQVVASSNAASDAAAAFWTSRFYTELVAQGDAPAAARGARRALRQTPHFRNPKYWAGIESYTSDRFGAAN